MTDHRPDPARGAEVLAMDRAHVFHSWSAQAGLKPLAIAAAEGSYFWDYDPNGNRITQIRFCNAEGVAGADCGPNTIVQ